MNIEKSIRDKITTLEVEMSKHEQVEVPIVHYFAEGLYAREMQVPKGTLFAGKVHKTETVGILAKGKITIWNENGERNEVEAPYTHIGKPGHKRIGFAVEDIVWITIHRTDLTDLFEIEKEQFITHEGDVDMFDFVTGKVRDKYLTTLSNEDGGAKCLP